MEEVVIVGGGIAGLATAVGLKRVGIRALVLERAEKLRVSGAVLNLSFNAWVALDALGVSHHLTSLYLPLIRGSIIDVASGEEREVKFPNTENKRGARPVHRRVLLQVLANELDPNSIRYSSNIKSIETEASITILHLEDGTVIKTKILIGCDGVNSVVARWLGLASPIHSGRSAVLGLANVPQDIGFKQEFKQFVDAGLRAGLVPMNGNEVYWFLVFPEGKDITTSPEEIQKQVIEKYGKDLPPTYLDVVRHADLSTLSWSPLKMRLPWDVIFGKLSKGNVTVAGDAMHPMTPELGQGGCSALEDAVVLSRHIGNSFIKNGRIVADEMAHVLNGYVSERRWRVTSLIIGSYISGWIQIGGSSWWMKFLRDTIFYGFLFRPVLNAVAYDCGKLPSNKTD